LKTEFSNEFSLQYRNFNLNSGNAFFGNLSFRGIKDKIVIDRVVVPSSTIQETSFLNTSGYFDSHAYYMYSIDAIEKVLNFNINSSLDYNNNISFINNEKNKGRNLTFMQGMQVNYMIDDWFNLDFRSSYVLNRVRNSLSAMFGTETNTLALGVGGKAYSRDWVFSFDVATHYNKGYGSVSEENPTLLNIYIEKAFGKNDRAVVRFQSFDLLNQNTGIMSEINANEYFYMKNDRLGRYFLLSFNLRLQKFPGKNESNYN
jgi:hypothetical protein